MDHSSALKRKFLAVRHTQPNLRGDFSAWHRGRAQFWIWALDVDTPALRARVAAAARSLDGLLLDGYRRAPHITLAICGFPAPQTETDDSYTPARLAAQCAALERLRPTPFTLTLGAMASFPSAPFLCVDDVQGRLMALRACLTGHAHDLSRADYVPHVTVGLYAGAWPTSAVVRRFAPPQTPLPLEVHRVSLMCYAAADIGGPLQTVADYAFDGRGLVWRSAPAAAGFLPD